MTCLENICDLNSYVPGKHTNRVAAYVLVIGRHLGLDPNWVQLLSDASRMYGIGKAMSCSSQSKLNLSLKSENYLSLHIDKDYSLAGYELLRDLPGDVFELAAEVALYHCENWDGSGAPIGASGVGIPLSARIVTVAVQFDKMTSLTDRDPEWLISRALLVIKADEGVQFDPSVVDSLLAAESEIRAIKKHFDGESAAQERIARPHLQKRKS